MDNLIAEQQIFDKVLEHARRQNCKAMQGDTCVYRSPDGLMCFVGCLIKDVDFAPVFEGYGICDILSDLEGLEINGTDYVFEEDYLDLLDQLQNLHDNCPVEKWESKFQSLAADYNLKYTPPTA